jgi:hypothetical protein
MDAAGGEIRRHASWLLRARRAVFSFPGVGAEGPDNIAIALFSFPSVAAYEEYRRKVADDPECRAATKHYNETKCFTKYERTFMRPGAQVNYSDDI